MRYRRSQKNCFVWRLRRSKREKNVRLVGKQVEKYSLAEFKFYSSSIENETDLVFGLLCTAGDLIEELEEAL